MSLHTTPPRRALLHRARATARLLTLVGATLVLPYLSACGGGSEPGPGPDDDATLSGVVRAAQPSDPLAGATVSLGARQATSDENGHFELTGLPVGAATVHAAKPGYLAADAAVTISAGANTHDFALASQEIYESGSNAVYVPAGVGPLRGTIIVLTDLNASGFVTGDPIVSGTGEPDLESGLQSLGQSFRALAKTAHVAVLGSKIIEDNASSDATLFNTLGTVGTTSGQSGLADAPVLVFGIGSAGPLATGLVSRQPERAIGLLAWVPVGLKSLTAPEGLAVPTFVILHGNDDPSRVAAARTAFSGNRGRGGLWALAVEPGIPLRTATGKGNAARIGWMSSVLALRLPANLADPLVPLDEASSWLGNQSTLDVAAWADYLGDRTAASWLPSESVATLWKQVGSSSGGGD